MAELQARLIIKADGAGTAAADVGRMGTALGATAQQADKAGAAAARAGKELGGVSAPAKAAGDRIEELAKRTGTSAGQLNAAFRSMPAQLTDVATQLQGGASPLTVLLQQGGQVKDQFGGIRPMFVALASAISPVAVGFGAAAAGLGLLVGGFVAGRSESDAFTRSMAITGGFAGRTAGQIDTLSREMAASGKVSIGTAREVTAALVSSGELQGSALDSAAKASASLAKVTGQSAADIVKGFDGITNGVAAWAEKANKSYNFLTGAQFAQIRSLEAQGRTQEAVKLTMDALSQAMDGRQTPSLGLMDTALKAVTTSWSNLWDKVKGFGRDQTGEEKIKSLTDALVKAEERANRAPRRGTMRTQGQAEQARDSVKEDLAVAIETEQIARRSAQRKAEEAAKNQHDILVQSSQYQASQAAISEAGSANILARERVGLEERRAATEAAFRRAEITARANQEAILAIDQAGIDAQLANLDRLNSIKQQFKPGNEIEEAGKAAALKQIEAQRLALQQQRVKLLADEASGKRDIAPLGGSVGPSDDLRRFRAQDEANVVASFQAQTEAQRAASLQLQQGNRELGLSLIQDQKARGQALIDIEAQQWRERVGLDQLNGDERRKAEQDLSDFIQLREAQLAEQLKPTYQRMLDDWADVNRLRKQSFEDLTATVIKDGEDAFVQLGRTGKLSMKQLVDDVLNQLLRLQYRQMVGQLGTGSNGSGLAGLFSSLFGGGGSGSFQAGSYNYLDYASLSAVGHRFDGAQRFAAGGRFTNSVVDRPTFFRFGKGGSQLGLMGEAGPEAVMPLERRGGELGVAALDGSGRQVGVMRLGRGRGGRLAVMAGGGGGAARAFAAGGSFGSGWGWSGGSRMMGYGGSAGGGGGGQAITIAPQISIDSRSDRSQVEALVRRGVEVAGQQAAALMAESARRGRSR